MENSLAARPDGSDCFGNHLDFFHHIAPTKNLPKIVQPLIPLILFTYNRPKTLRRTLECLRRNHVPLIHVYSDGPKNLEEKEKVREVRNIIHQIDWCETVIVERDENLGLGVSVRTGVSEVLQKHDSAIVFEDDLICVDGCYKYLCEALKHYSDDPRVMSVTGWTHPLVTPKDVRDQPYFDGRAECWVWGTWARAWAGMERDASSLIQDCKSKGIDEYRYGADLIEQAKRELGSNIWAVRFLFWHILNRGLCLRPPWSMVEHIGVGTEGTNVSSNAIWQNPPLKDCPPTPLDWPKTVENPQCSSLWQETCGYKPGLLKMSYIKSRRLASRALKALGLRK